MLSYAISRLRTTYLFKGQMLSLLFHVLYGFGSDATLLSFDISTNTYSILIYSGDSYSNSIAVPCFSSKFTKLPLSKSPRQQGNNIEYEEVLYEALSTMPSSGSSAESQVVLIQSAPNTLHVRISRAPINLTAISIELKYKSRYTVQKQSIDSCSYVTCIIQ